MDTNRRAEIRRVRRELTRIMGAWSAHRRPTREQAEAELRRVLRFYPLPTRVGIRINRVEQPEGQPVRCVLDVYDPTKEKP